MVGTVKVSTRAMGKVGIGEAAQYYGNEEGYQPRNYTGSWGSGGYRGRDYQPLLCPQMRYSFIRGGCFSRVSICFRVDKIWKSSGKHCWEISSPAQGFLYSQIQGRMEYSAHKESTPRCPSHDQISSTRLSRVPKSTPPYPAPCPCLRANGSLAWVELIGVPTLGFQMPNWE